MDHIEDAAVQILYYRTFNLTILNDAISLVRLIWIVTVTRHSTDTSYSYCNDE